MGVLKPLHTPGPWQKPRGVLRIDPSVAPPGLVSCFTCSDNQFYDILNPGATTLSSPGSGVVSTSSMGLGFDGTLGANANWLASSGSNSFTGNNCSVEALVYMPGSISGSADFCGTGNNPSGVVGTVRCILSYGFSGKLVFMVGGGAGWVLTTSAVSLDTFHHIVGTYDGTTASIYIDGILNNTATLASVSSTFTPPYYIVGETAFTSSSGGTILICNRANSVWDAETVKGRYLSPFSFLVEQESEMSSLGLLASAVAMLARAKGISKGRATTLVAMPMLARSQSTAASRGLVSSIANLAAAGTAATQAKLKAGMSLAAALSGKTSAQTKASLTGVYSMAFSAKAKATTKVSAGFNNTVFLLARSAAQAKARTVNTLRIILSATSRSSSRVKGVYSGGSSIVRSKFYAYFIS